MKPILASATGFFTGVIGSFSTDDFSKCSTALCALVGVAYTVWKWRKESKADDKGDAA